MQLTSAARGVALLAAAALMTGACTSDSAGPATQRSDAAPASTEPRGGEPGSPGATTSTGSGKPPGAGRVVVIVSVDGLNPDAITTLGADRLPAFTKLADEGASTLNARSSFEATVTLPNHTSMLTGRTIAGADGSSVMVNGDRGGTLTDIHGSYVPGVFDVAHDHGLTTAFFAEKSKFNLLLRSWDANRGAADSVGDDDGQDKVDVSDIAPAARLLPELLAALTDQSAQLLFLHIAAPDSAGHATRFMGPAYLDAVTAADTEIGAILGLVRSQPALRRSVTLIVTADHGGVPPGYRFADVLGNYRIPFFVWGRGAAPGSDLYILNADSRRDPGTSRPSYDGVQPIRNRDATSLALELLGLPALHATTSALKVR